MTASRPGLLAVHAHPDDETLSTGGLLAAWAAGGGAVTVVTCTRGELGEVIGPELAHLEGDGPALAAHRETELARALEALGVTDHVFVDRVPDPDGSEHDAGAAARFSDSGMAWADVGRAGRLEHLPAGAFVGVPLDAAARRLARLLRARRPDVVVTYEPAGGYGHPDHVRAHEVTMRAVALAADAQVRLAGADTAAHVVRTVLWAAHDADGLRGAYRELATHPAVERLRRDVPTLTLPDPDGPLPSVAVPRAELDLVVDVSGVLDRVTAALRAHATQVQVVTVWAAPPGDDPTGQAVVGCLALSNDVLAPLLAAEAYRVGGGDASSVRSWPVPVAPVA